MAQLKFKNDKGDVITIEGDPSSPPSDSELDSLFDQHKKREDVVSGAIAEAKARKTEILQKNLANVDPRLAGGANNEEVTPESMATGALLTAGALSPLGVGALPGVIGGAARFAEAQPVVSGAALGGATGYATGGIPGAIKGALYGAGGGILGKASPEVGKVLRYLGKWGKPVQDAAEMTAGEMRSIVSSLGKAGEGWVTNPSVEEVAAKMIPRGAPQTVSSMMGGAAPAAETAPATVSSMMSEAPAAKGFVKTVEPLTPESILARIAKLKEGGMSKGQIISALKETHGLKPNDARKVVELIEAAQ